MRIAYLDCFAGISGDMFLSALLGLGIHIDFLRKELAKLDLDGYTIDLIPTKKNALQGNKLNITFNTSSTARNLLDIKKLISQSGLKSDIKDKGILMFETLAKAEAKVHGVDISKVHFHEVGAVDSIIDIMGALICLDKLKISKLISSPIHVGRGFVNTQHGLLPIPAPATLELLKDKPVYSKDIEAELTTPTGALILDVLVDGFGAIPRMQVKKISYGAGSYNIKQFPNMLRITIGDTLEANITENKIFVIETNIDDMNPQLYDYIMERLLKKGAKDVFITPIHMKKNRPANKITVLSLSEDIETLSNILFSETTSLGLRIFEVHRKELKREIIKLNTEWGEIKFKIAVLKDGKNKIAPEYEDCKKIAKKTKLPLDEVYKNLLAIGKDKLNQD